MIDDPTAGNEPLVEKKILSLIIRIFHAVFEDEILCDQQQVRFLWLRCLSSPDKFGILWVLIKRGII